MSFFYSSAVLVWFGDRLVFVGAVRQVFCQLEAGVFREPSVRYVDAGKDKSMSVAVGSRPFCKRPVGIPFGAYGNLLSVAIRPLHVCPQFIEVRISFAMFQGV